MNSSGIATAGGLGKALAEWISVGKQVPGLSSSCEHWSVVWYPCTKAPIKWVGAWEGECAWEGERAWEGECACTCTKISGNFANTPL